MKIRNLAPLFAVFFVLAMSQAYAASDGHGDFLRAKEIIEKKIDCKSLSQNDLEALGEYFMEQMHPGSAHELMDSRMGGEGSESLRQAHINMGSKFYCNEFNGKYQMMGMMGMHEGYSGASMAMWFFWWIVGILVVLILILLLIFLIKKINEKGGRRK